MFQDQMLVLPCGTFHSDFAIFCNPVCLLVYVINCGFPVCQVHINVVPLLGRRVVRGQIGPVKVDEALPFGKHSANFYLSLTNVLWLDAVNTL